MNAHSYRVTAKHYDDAYRAKLDLQDLPFYVELAKNKGGPVLEIACGTGRILRSIAGAGIEIHGFDNSAAMLEVATRRLEEEPAELQRRVSVFAGT